MKFKIETKVPSSNKRNLTQAPPIEVEVNEMGQDKYGRYLTDLIEDEMCNDYGHIFGPGLKMTIERTE